MFCAETLADLGFVGPITAGHFIENRQFRIPWFLKPMLSRVYVKAGSEMNLLKYERIIGLLEKPIGGYHYEPLAVIVRALNDDSNVESFLERVENFQELDQGQPGLD